MARKKDKKTQKDKKSQKDKKTQKTHHSFNDTFAWRFQKTVYFRRPTERHATVRLPGPNSCGRCCFKCACLLDRSRHHGKNDSGEDQGNEQGARFGRHTQGRVHPGG